MPQYDLHVLCTECNDFHDAFVRVTLNETFEVRRVSDVYKGNVPLVFYQAVSDIRCSKTQNRMNQRDTSLMVLAEVGSWSLRTRDAKPDIRDAA